MFKTKYKVESRKSVHVNMQARRLSVEDLSSSFLLVAFGGFCAVEL